MNQFISLILLVLIIFSSCDKVFAGRSLPTVPTENAMCVLGRHAWTHGDEVFGTEHEIVCVQGYQFIASSNPSVPFVQMHERVHNKSLPLRCTCEDEYYKPFIKRKKNTGENNGIKIPIPSR